MPRLKKAISSLTVFQVIALVFGIALLVLNVVRIFNVSITVDETQYRAVDTYSALMKDDWGSANNHIFHSLLRKFFAEIFNDSLFFLRLDSLLAHIFFVIFSYRICTLLFGRQWWILISFITINTVSPFVFEFWGLSRGYALGLSLMTISIYYLLRYIGDNRPKLLCICLACAVLSVYSNFSLINYFVSLLVTIAAVRIAFIWNELSARILLKELFLSLVFCVILALIIAVPLKHIVEHGELRFLGSAGFEADTVASLVKEGLYIQEATHKEVIAFILGLIKALTGLSAAYWLYACYKSWVAKNAGVDTKRGVALFFLLAAACISVILQYKIFHVNYVVDRAAMFFIILFILQYLYILYRSSLPFPRIGMIVLLFSFLALTGNFWYNMNTTSTRLWWFDKDDIPVLKRIAGEAAATGKEKTRIIVNWKSGACFEYNIEHFYKGKFDIGRLEQNQSTIDSSGDFYYVEMPDIKFIPASCTKEGLYEAGAFALFRR